ncbi:MAG: putative nicotinate-nucleotide adenylyltransferase [Candidatus Dichloromethanomonas elyunquensis]|nr:MAG: putative nicotinate-nucleotide adenylyltransferase [Candidatus Dichloromethanomonas elyunquensis]
MEANVRDSMTGGLRLGIMGGTFDPIHYGHLVAAETARIELELDNVLFIPAGNPPHKIDRIITDANLRFEMVEMSIRSNNNFKVSRMEIERTGPTYTIDTLRILKKTFSDQELYFITGTDALKEMLTWREPEEIIKLSKIVGVSRPGYDSRNVLSKIFKKYPFTKERIYQLEVPALAISSTDIRSRVFNQKSIRYLLPEEVRLFIKTNHLYQSK